MRVDRVYSEKHISHYFYFAIVWECNRTVIAMRITNYVVLNSVGP